MSNFQKLRDINVNSKIEKKNNLSYLSWAWAVDQLLMQDPSASWEYMLFNVKDANGNDNTVPYSSISGTAMIFCTVTAFGKKLTAQLPVMDYRNKAIVNPDAYAVNTAMQRCLVKGIALHGLGLYIYAGEDLPEEDKVQTPKASVIKATDGAGETLSEEDKQFIRDLAIEAIAAHADGDIAEAHQIYTGLNSEERVFMWTLLDSKVRRSIKDYAGAK